jgi:error-prone DNA polymerase
MTIEDETGFANVVFFEKLFDKFRKEILQSRLIMIEGKLQIEGEVIHVIVSRCYNMTKYLSQLIQPQEEAADRPTLFNIETITKDENIHSTDLKEKKVFSEGRNFR